MIVLVVMIMAKQKNDGATFNGSIELKEQEKLMFHDFLGAKSTALASKITGDSTLLAEVAASPPPASASSGGGRGRISSASDLGSVERQIGNHLDGNQVYSQRSDISGSNMRNRLTGSKRSNSDSLFTGQESPESLHWTKMLRNGPRNFSTNLSPMVYYPPRGGQTGHIAHQLSLSRFKDANAGPSPISQTAADEGSRTGIKGSGILNSVNAEKNSSTIMPSGSKLESSTSLRRQDLTSGSRQMTIFYGGQAHVFDDVHPNKADVIMALAGSNGGSWSTIFSPKPAVKKLENYNYRPSEESEGGHIPFAQFSASGNASTSQGTGPRDQILTQAGVRQARDMRNPVQAMEPVTEGRREL